MFAEELAESAAEKKHLTATQAARLAREGAVKQLGLIHYSRDTRTRAEETTGEAREIFPAAFLTRTFSTSSCPSKINSL